MKPRIGIGFHTERATFEWIGFDTGRELSKYFDVSFFDEHESDFSRFQVIIIVKKHLEAGYINRVKLGDCKIIYLPVDNYERPDQIAADAEILKLCSVILIHCERLRPHFSPYCRDIRYIEHHNRFGLSKMVDYKCDGYAVWVGGGNHLDYQVNYLQQHPLGMPIKFVAGYLNHVRHVKRLPIPDENEVIEWTPRNQMEAMAGARCAFDIKGTDWQQMMKPPVKAQKFIMSGLPMAVNPESFAFEYFKANGLILAHPKNISEWTSFEYFQACQDFGMKLRKNLTLENVGLDYKKIIEEIL